MSQVTQATALQAPGIKVSSKSMPAVGLGLWKIDQNSAADAVYEAIWIAQRIMAMKNRLARALLGLLLRVSAVVRSSG